ncbi:MAG: tRNA(Ile)-lysidine synthetase, partial [Collinsella sp.]
DIVRRARELAGAGGVVAMVDAATLGFADRDSERMLAGSRGEIPAEARLARLWVDGPAPGM